MNDYREIRRHDASRLQPKHTVILHADSRLALTLFFASSDRAKSVVIAESGYVYCGELRPLTFSWITQCRSSG